MPVLLLLRHILLEASLLQQLHLQCSFRLHPVIYVVLDSSTSPQGLLGYYTTVV